jgi:outer membrane protein assembly factor BamB
MDIKQLVFAGFNSRVFALDRDTGLIVWNKKMESGYVSLLLDEDRLIVSSNGYLYCLDPLTGEVLWNNPMSGFGTGPTHLLSSRGQSSPTLLQQAAAIEAQARSSAGAT